MTTSLFSRRDLSIGDTPIIEVSDSSEPRHNLVPIGPTFMDLKYVSASGNDVVGIQQMNRECDMDQEIDQRPYRVEEDRGGLNVGSEKQINKNPYAQVIS